jgi:hypothetical protein
VTTSALPPTTTTPASEPTTGTGAGQGTRTQPAPRFTEEPTSGPLSLSAAEQVLAARGYTTTETNGYRPEQLLSVLTGSGTAGEHAFFFTHGVYLGTDASEPSRSISVVSHSGPEVTLAYGLYGASGTSVGTAQVRFKLEGGSLQALDPIPSASSRQ